jgi:hypothetical protein
MRSPDAIRAGLAYGKAAPHFMRATNETQSPARNGRATRSPRPPGRAERGLFDIVKVKRATDARLASVGAAPSWHRIVADAR